MTTYTLLRHISLYPYIRRYRSKKEIGPLGWGETVVRLDFRLWGIWLAVKSTNGIKLVDGSQMPVHVMHALNGKVVMGQRDIEAAKGTPYDEAWRESMVSAINQRLGLYHDSEATEQERNSEVDAFIKKQTIQAP